MWLRYEEIELVSEPSLISVEPEAVFRRELTVAGEAAISRVIRQFARFSSIANLARVPANTH